MTDDADSTSDTLQRDPNAPASPPALSPHKTSAGALSLAQSLRDVLGARAGAQGPHSAERYVELREIGRGGMGRVCEEWDRWLGRRVAVKRLLDAAPTDALAQRRFELEALVTAELDHQGIPTVYERSTGVDGQPFYTMRLVEGRPLSELLKAANDFESRMALLPQVALVVHTLAFAHERGVVHRDVKPENVVIGPHGEAVLLDWGIAKVRGLAEDSGQARDVAGREGSLSTHHGAVLGTPAYMAPEQARGEVDVIDERSDVFALGAMLYHLLAGHPPYRGPTLTEVLTQAREARFVDIDRAAPLAAESLRAVVKRAMAPAATARFASAKELAAALDAFTASAISRPASRGIERFINASSWFGLVVCLLIALGGWLATPTFREMGSVALMTLAFFVVGVAVAAVDWQTRGRHRLAALGLAFTAITATCGFGGTIAGLLNVYAFLGRPEVVRDAVTFREVLVVGHREALGNVMLGGTLALLQGVILALAWRRSGEKN